MIANSSYTNLNEINYLRQIKIGKKFFSANKALITKGSFGVRHRGDGRMIQPFYAASNTIGGTV
jgi:hypothetical protein